MILVSTVPLRPACAAGCEEQGAGELGLDVRPVNQALVIRESHYIAYLPHPECWDLSVLPHLDGTVRGFDA